MNPAGVADTAAAELTMDSVLTELKAGKDFAEVAKDFQMIQEQRIRAVILVSSKEE
ncbi:MAG: hypothetical protein MZV64_39270 [Ignavibacteriales bacterium]|nr:hypothetical protein [Ignavibacteriales bacterium]